MKQVYVIQEDPERVSHRSHRSFFKKCTMTFIGVVALLTGLVVFVVVFGNIERSNIAPTFPQSSASSIYPSQLLNLLGWSLAMKAYPEISIRNLFRLNDSYIYVNEKMDSVVFRAPIMSEDTLFPNFLVETNGSYIANWNTNAEYHTLEITEKVQYMGSSEEVILLKVRDCCQTLFQVYVQGTQLQARNQTLSLPIDTAYAIGKLFKLRILVGRNYVLVYYDDDQHYTSFIIPSSTTAHFVVGADVVTQEPRNATEVWLQSLRIRRS